MPRYRTIAASALLLLVTAACNRGDGLGVGEVTEAIASETPTYAATATGTAVANATPELAPSNPEFEERPLTDLSRAVIDYIEEREGDVAVAVLVLSALAPSESIIYTWRGDERFRLASIMKVPIMLSVMTEAVEAGRDLTDEQLALMTAMITISDNDSADFFWQELGGGRSVEHYLHSIGIREIFADRTDDWGNSLGTAFEIAGLFGLIGFGEILDEEMRSLALELLQRVHPDQSWGVTTAENHQGPGSVIGLKNGWYPDRAGWRVHSGALILPANGHQAYAIVVLTARQPSKEYGIETIEEVARLLHVELHSELVPLVPPAQSF